MSVITPGACGKFLGSSVDFPSIEVYLKRGLKMTFLCANRSLSRASLSILQILSPLGNGFFPFWGLVAGWVGGMRKRNRYPRREAERLLGLPLFSGSLFFLLAFVCGFRRSTSTRHFIFGNLSSSSFSSSSFTIFNEADRSSRMTSVSMSLFRCDNSVCCCCSCC